LVDSTKEDFGKSWGPEETEEASEKGPQKKKTISQQMELKIHQIFIKEP